VFAFGRPAGEEVVAGMFTMERCADVVVIGIVVVVMHVAGRLSKRSLSIPSRIRSSSSSVEMDRRVAPVVVVVVVAGDDFA